jgi:hypothetical protein
LKKLLAAALLAVAVGAATPAHAAAPSPGGQCDRGNVDVACRPSQCAPDYPCTITICLVWGGYGCKV